MIRKLFMLVILALIGAFALPTTNALAASCGSPAECTAAGVESADSGSSSATLPEVLKTIVTLLMFVIGGVAVIMLVIGGIRYTTSQGDSSSMQAAKNTILYSVIGLIVALSGYAIVTFVVGMFTGGGGGGASTGGSGASSSSGSSTQSGSAGSGSSSPTPQTPATPTTPRPTPQPTTPTPTTPAPTTPPPVTPPRPTTPTYIYRNGTYSASTDYSPRGEDDTITVTLAVSNDKVSSVTVVDNPSNGTSQDYVDMFLVNYRSAVVGQSLDTLSPSRIGGASDTTDAFNETLDAIRNQARA